MSSAYRVFEGPESIRQDRPRGEPVPRQALRVRDIRRQARALRALPSPGRRDRRVRPGRGRRPPRDTPRRHAANNAEGPQRNHARQPARCGYARPARRSRHRRWRAGAGFRASRRAAISSTSWWRVSWRCRCATAAPGGPSIYTAGALAVTARRHSGASCLARAVARASRAAEDPRQPTLLGGRFRHRRSPRSHIRSGATRPYVSHP
jgi:hypothetical protein